MPVRFKGLSEYQRNFLWKKSYLSESYNPSVGRRYPWAGLRSDQLGITREPSFISKRRVPYHDPQISKSLEWNGAIPENDIVISPKPEAPETELQEAEQKEDVTQERVPKRTRSQSTDSRAEGASDSVENNADIIANHIPVKENEDPEPSTKLHSENVDNGLDRVLRKKAGLTVVPSRNILRNSEYQRQFVWKTPKETAPVFAANQVFHNKSKFVPQFKGNSVIHETEYRRNFKGLSPVKEPKLRNDLKDNGNFEAVSPEKKCDKTDDPLRLEAEMESKESSQPKKKLTPWRHQRLGKVNSEYRAKFLSPAQYLYKAGAWTRVKENIPDQVKELREKAEFYRKRVQGTHFSRDHLNQLLSDNNRCWDVSSTTSSEGTISSNIRALDLAGDPTSHKTLQKCPPTTLEEKRPVLEEQPQKNTTEKLGMSDAPTLPVRRRLAWDAENTNEGMQKQLREEEGEEEEKMEKDKQVHSGELDKLEVHEKSEADKIKEGSDSSSVSSGKEGRLPTPKLRELGGIQRTHHDLTTPAVGGAVLVSPSKVRPSVPEPRKRMSSQDVIESAKNDFRKKESRAISLLTSPAAGIKTIDPLPLREDSEANHIPKLAEVTLPVSKIPEYPTNTPGQSPSPPCAPSYWHPSRRIQGSLRDPEFQHNVGKAKMNNFQLPQHEVFNDEDEDRLSEISARSAASSLRAFQTLARAQKRKENFWGKT
ncbi:nuclear protein MDM1 isoform X2 [Canis lupus baileyi]|uniref:Nuclear protein MDM1 n=1 Tax=Canis lupus familiaris TaxID=9615 RepID=A0A8C0TLI2_CANLF|nr:nuclear protein MDM1 isoform X2 [Canis lupus dingo]XP_038405891.1 nuclear protein MDM1 isoform X2 [Canis lupus familiaris]XP_038495130.1 nuclear protein MDM1 isoform X2 [Canis lupus familiaris]|eukprot:XP_005625659.1 nuclear protein MDM1 isoform X2 [Canis lupus familiaris]